MLTRSTRTFVLATAGLVAVSIGVARAIGSRSSSHPTIGAAKRGEILDAATLVKKLKPIQRDFKQMFGHTSIHDVDAAFIKLRHRIGHLETAASGFFPEANDLTDKALVDLKAARDEAYVDTKANSDAAWKTARTAELEEKRERNINEWWRRK